MGGTAIGGDNIQAIDTSITALISGDLTLATSLQTQIAALIANPKPTYTISGPAGSQNVSWESYQLMLMQQLDAVTNRIREWFKLKQVNLPYFNIRRGR